MKTAKTAQPTDLNAKVKRFPVIEIFGPTIQGEGLLIGSQTIFVRFGGCDYRCSWCDTPYAVDPEEVRKNATYLTAQEIVDKVVELGPGTPWVTFSGGNPLLYHLDELTETLSELRYDIAVETQGTMFKEWVFGCSSLVLSPKPPSSGMVTDWGKLAQFYQPEFALISGTMVSAKIVVFDEKDLDYAEEVCQRFPEWPLFLQVGNNVGQDDLASLVARLEWLVNQVIKRPTLTSAIVLPQLHVLMWGNQRGV